MKIPKIKYPIGNFSKASFWFSVSIGIILIVIAIALTAFSAYVDWDFIKSAYLIIIPIIAVGITTKISTSYWQLNKERLSIKRDFLDDYEKSYKRRSTLGENFSYKIIEPYVVYASDSDTIKFIGYSITKINKTKISEPIQAFLKLSKSDNEKPFKKFWNDYLNFQNEVHKSTFFSNKFMSSYRLYCEQDIELEKKINKLENNLNVSEDILLRLMHSNGSKELLNCYELFHKANKSIINQLKDVELNMVELKFKKLK